VHVEFGLAPTTHHVAGTAAVVVERISGVIVERIRGVVVVERISGVIGERGGAAGVFAGLLIPEFAGGCFCVSDLEFHLLNISAHDVENFLFLGDHLLHVLEIGVDVINFFLVVGPPGL